MSDWWNWAYFCANFRKFWKYDPCLYQFLHWIRGHLYTRRLILRPISAARPRIDLCTKNPPPGFNTKLYRNVCLRWIIHVGNNRIHVFMFKMVKKMQNSGFEMVVGLTHPFIRLVLDAFGVLLWKADIHVRGRVKKSLQPSFFSSHGCI